MKCKELMCGDWVLINGAPHKIQAIDDTDAEIQADDELYYVGEDRSHSEDKIEGIPVTSEILEKNGFNSGLTPLDEALIELNDFEDDDFREDDEDTEARPDAFFKEHRSYADGEAELHLYSSDDLKKGNLFVDELSLNRHLECTFQDFLQVHELQHMLRLCRLNTLADNFRI